MIENRQTMLQIFPELFDKIKIKMSQIIHFLYFNH